MTFNGFDPLPVNIFRGDQDISTADWGTIKMPMPFFGLQGFEPAEFRPVLDSQTPYVTGTHEDFVYARQCTHPPD